MHIWWHGFVVHRLQMKEQCLAIELDGGKTTIKWIRLVNAYQFNSLHIFDSTDDARRSPRSAFSCFVIYDTLSTRSKSRGLTNISRYILVPWTLVEFMIVEPLSKTYGVRRDLAIPFILVMVNVYYLFQYTIYSWEHTNKTYLSPVKILSNNQIMMLLHISKLTETWEKNLLSIKINSICS